MHTTDTIADTTISATTVRPRRALKRLGIALATLGALATTGVLCEAIASRGDAATVPAGRLIDVGGHRLYLDCEGTGGPAIVMDAGLGGSSLDWLLVAPQLAKYTTVCTYDRAGMGLSDPGPLPRSPSRNADELHQLLVASGVQGPYVLVGHSLAGKTLRMFAAAHPDEVAGMVLVDARSERIDAAMSPEQHDGMTAAIRTQTTLYAVARRFGLMRLLGATLFGSPNLPHEDATRLILRESDPNALAATVDEGSARSDDDAALATATLGDISLTVIAAGDSMRNNPGWPEAQAAMAALSTHGQLITADHSSHAIQIDDPAMVIDAVRSVLEAARERQ